MYVKGRQDAGRYVFLIYIYRWLVIELCIVSALLTSDGLNDHTIPDALLYSRTYLVNGHVINLLTINSWAKVGNILLLVIETLSPEGTFCDTVQVPSGGADMELN